MSETFTVRELCNALSGAVNDAFPDEVWVKGSISGLTRSPNGHVYFDLVDPAAEVGAAAAGVLPVALFASERHRVNQILRRSGQVRMSDGVEIRVRGRVAFYPPQGRVQLKMSLIDPAYTLGQLAEARQALLDRLAADGVLNRNRGLELPVPPLRIGLVTSEGSAAHADFAHELELSGYPFEVILFDCRVQGAEAVPSLVAAIGRAGTWSAPTGPLDAVALVRGGGARTDLAAFDHEQVARAIAACPLPVLVGVGHEIDRSVADDVAHTSAKTPTAVAALLVDAVRWFDNEVGAAAERLARLAGLRLDTAAAGLAAAGRRLSGAATALGQRHEARIDQHRARLRHLAERHLERSDASLHQIDLRLRALDPALTLARGWSITHTASGELVRDASAVPAGTVLVTTLASGRLASTVTGNESTAIGGPPGAGPTVTASPQDDDAPTPGPADAGPAAPLPEEDA